MGNGSVTPFSEFLADVPGAYGRPPDRGREHNLLALLALLPESADFGLLVPSGVTLTFDDGWDLDFPDADIVYARLVSPQHVDAWYPLFYRSGGKFAAEALAPLWAEPVDGDRSRAFLPKITLTY